jgi:hypothetical protein
MRVLVCGSRSFIEQGVVSAVLDGVRMGIGDDPEFVVIEGGALGADRCARVWARAWYQQLETFPADWAKHGKAAGPIRNQQMLKEGKPDVVWAFVDKPLAESRGTADMVRIARYVGVPTYVVEAS